MRDWIAVSFLAICLAKGTFDHLTDTRALDWFRETSARMQALQTTAETLRALGARGPQLSYIEADAGSEWYFGLQYQLLPAILVPSPKQPFTILHCSDQQRLKEIAGAGELELVGAAGNHFYLFKQEGR